MPMQPSPLRQDTSGTYHKEHNSHAGSLEAGGIGTFARIFERNCVYERESDLESYDEDQAEHA